MDGQAFSAKQATCSPANGVKRGLTIRLTGWESKSIIIVFSGVQAFYPPCSFPGQRIFSVGEARQRPLGRTAPTFHESPTPHLPSGGIGYGLKAQKFLVQAKRRTGYVVYVRMCAMQGVKILIFSFFATVPLPLLPLQGDCQGCGYNTQGAIGRIACIDGGLCGKFQSCKARTKQESYWQMSVPHGYERGWKPYKPAGMAGERLAGFALQRQQRTCVRC